LLEELGVSEAIARDGHEVMPRFRIFTPSGHFVILMQMSDDASDRQRRIRLVGLFMAWKMATGFVLSGELRDPDAISSFAVLRDERMGVMRRIERGPPISFGETTSLDESHIDDGLIVLLPRGATTLTAELIAELERAFGKDGETPALRVS
jgi:hypothetical protein